MVAFCAEARNGKAASRTKRINRYRRLDNFRTPRELPEHFDETEYIFHPSCTTARFSNGKDPTPKALQHVMLFVFADI
jgi:hypothetical protein